MATMEKKKPVNPLLLKRCFGNGKELKTLHRVLSPPSSSLENLKKKEDSESDHRQDWNDDERMTRSKRKLHQGYQDYQNQRRKIQVLDIKDLPKPAIPQRGNVFKNKLLKSRNCLAF
ncbi:mediator of RNA polymerase II transcription subunit 26c [Pyrus ussuriensis x Pyrus communis]|uniref:Mediator of RNA polymerase II transcription subunit 26c n=1 Tax=Pyrus ussuriensis x Pyrus communis TaxID=2448454 RepID=A0A5N5EWZ4_9ROSA|nr:mediator of RNA polymerase II transcription subunit 26c [Pyrus ussuriensis x Pyrus communis]